MSAISESIEQSSPASFSDNGAPSLVFTTRDGVRHGWALHLLTRWRLDPGANEVLTLWLGDGGTVALRGSGLDEIAEALEMGKGGAIAEIDRRFSALAQHGRAFVAEISIAV